MSCVDVNDITFAWPGQRVPELCPFFEIGDRGIPITISDSFFFNEIRV